VRSNFDLRFHRLGEARAETEGKGMGKFKFKGGQHGYRQCCDLLSVILVISASAPIRTGGPKYPVPRLT
jgi:hypothetical protein